LINLVVGECAEVDKAIVILIDKNDLNAAIHMKQSVIELLNSVEKYDQLGFAKVLLMKAQQRISEMRAIKSRNSIASLLSMRKAIDYDAMQEEDEDMGYDLFE